MNPLLLLFAYLALTETVVFCNCWRHNAVFKSIFTTDRECSAYLQDIDCEGDCTARCTGLLARYWNDSVGVPSPTINRFYKPTANDRHHLKRTKHCLNEISTKVPLQDVCQRAETSTACYYQHYGELQAEAPKFVPFTDLQHQQVLRDCVGMLKVSKSIFTGYLKHGFEHYPEAKCLLRCFLIREGHYTDAGGPDLGRMSVQCEGRYSGEKFRRKASRCIESLQRQCTDKCELAFRIANECVNGKVALLPIFLGASSNIGNITFIDEKKTTVLVRPFLLG